MKVQATQKVRLRDSNMQLLRVAERGEQLDAAELGADFVEKRLGLYLESGQLIDPEQLANEMGDALSSPEVDELEA